MFGFLDPNQVTRAAHLMPAFSQGRTRELLGPSIAHNEKDEEEWLKYYVGMFADRDMMRHLGGGIGHKATYDSVPPTPAQDLAMEDDDQPGEDDNGAEDEDMEGVEVTGDIGSGEDDYESGEGSSCAGEEADYGYEDEEGSEVDEEMEGETEEVDEFSDDESDGSAEL